MAIFNSYVSLPEGTSSVFCFETSAASDHHVLTFSARRQRWMWKGKRWNDTWNLGILWWPGRSRSRNPVLGVSNVRAGIAGSPGWQWNELTKLCYSFVMSPMDLTCDLGSLLHLRKTSANVGVLALASSGGKNRTSWPDCWTFAAPGWKMTQSWLFWGTISFPVSFSCQSF